MSIHKNQHTDGSSSFWQRVINFLVWWERPCPSYINHPTGGLFHCAGEKGHNGHHFCEGIYWCYGDDFFK